MSSFNQLAFLIEKTRALTFEDKESIIFCQINNGLSSNPQYQITNEHQKILELFNGGRFGIIDIWDIDCLPKQQFRGLDNTNLYEIGQILYEPIFLNKLNNTISFVSYSDNELTDTNLNIVEFMVMYIFGEFYSSLIQNYPNDLWLDFLSQNFFNTWIQP